MSISEAQLTTWSGLGSVTQSADTYAAIRGEMHIGLPTFADGARSMSIVEAVLRSSATNQWTSITDGPTQPA